MNGLRLFVCWIEAELGGGLGGGKRWTMAVRIWRGVALARGKKEAVGKCRGRG